MRFTAYFTTPKNFLSKQFHNTQNNMGYTEEKYAI